MASKEGSSYDWILGEDADEDLEPWQRVLKENAKNAKVERFLELLRGILGPDELLNLAGMVRDMDVRHVQKLYMKQWQEHAMASAHGGADPTAMMMGHPPPMPRAWSSSGVGGGIRQRVRHARAERRPR